MKYITAILASAVSATRPDNRMYCDRNRDWVYDDCYEQYWKNDCVSDDGWWFWNDEEYSSYWVHSQDYYEKCEGCDLSWHWDDCLKQEHQRDCASETVGSHVGTKGWYYKDEDLGFRYYVHTQEWYG